MPASASADRAFQNLTRRHVELLVALERLEPRCRQRMRLASTLGISLAGVKTLLLQIYDATGLHAMDDVADWWSDNKVDYVLWVAERVRVTANDLRGHLTFEAG